jgi:flagellar biosynthesis/type III secretory pathway M-ring protein FliF/YscJ
VNVHEIYGSLIGVTVTLLACCIALCMIRVVLKKLKLRRALKKDAKQKKEKVSDDEAEDSSITVFEQGQEEGAVGGRVEELNKYGEEKKAEKERKEQEENQRKEKEQYEQSFSQAAKRFWAFRNVFKRQNRYPDDDIENVGAAVPLQHNPQPAEVKFSVDEENEL